MLTQVVSKDLHCVQASREQNILGKIRYKLQFWGLGVHSLQARLAGIQVKHQDMFAARVARNFCA